MSKVSVDMLRDSKVFKWYRLVRKWAAKNYKLSEPDFEVLMFLYCERRFTIKEFKRGTYIVSWDTKRWKRFLDDGWVKVWRDANNYTQKYKIYQVTEKTRVMINRVYRILLGEEEIPVTNRSKFYKNKTYTDKVMNRSIDFMIKEKRNEKENG